MTGKFEHTMDAKGRLFIPAKLREELGASFQIAIGSNREEYAGLGRDVVITGSSNKAKIWDKETWERRSAPQLDPAKVADMFDMLGL